MPPTSCPSSAAPPSRACWSPPSSTTPSSDPAVQKFVEAYKAKYKGANPDWFAANSYDVIMLAAQAAKNAGKNDRTAINDALGKIGTYQGISGPITFDENGDVVKPLSIVIVKDGAWPRLPSSRRSKRPALTSREGASGAAPLAPSRCPLREPTPRPRGPRERTRPTTRQRPHDRLPVRPHRRGLHDGVRHHRADQLRLRRALHVRRLHHHHDDGPRDHPLRPARSACRT